MTTEITRARLADDLMRLGIKAGDHIGLALSFKSLGRVTGGPDAFIDALLDVVGNEGTIMANTYTANMRHSSIAFAAADCIYDSQSSRCNTGIVPETIRLRHNALRSRHPVMSVAAIGSLARFLTVGHDENVPAYMGSLDFGANVNTRRTLNTKTKKIFWLLIICFALYSLPYLVSSTITVTDELCFDYFSSLLAEHGTLKFIPDGDRLFGFSGFVPRSFSYTAFGEAVPKLPPGFILLAALAKTIAPGTLFFLINPILGVCCVLLLYGIGKQLLSNDQHAVWAAAILASAPIFFHWTQMFFADIANLAVFLLALWCLLRALDTQRLVYFTGFGLSLGSMIWMRQTSAILLIPIAIYLFLNRHRIRLGSCWLPSLAFAMTIALLMTFNTQVYGGPFRTGYTLGHGPTVSEPAPTLSAAYSDLARLVKHAMPNYKNLWSHAKELPLSFTLAFPPFLLALFGLISGLKTPEKRPFTLFMWALFLVMFCVFGGRNTYGVERDELTLQSSFLRYMLPLFALLPIPTILALEQLKIARKRWLFILILVNLGGAAFAHFGLIHATLNRLYNEDVARFIRENTDEKTVVFSPYWHSIMFPDRLIRSRRPATEEALMAITEGILRKGYSIAFIYHASDSTIFDALGKNVALKKVALEKVTGPNKLNALLQMLPAPIPKHVYPVTLWKMSSVDQPSTN